MISPPLARLLALGCIALLPASCGPRLISPAPELRPPAASIALDWSDWGVILNRTVTPLGVDYNAAGADGRTRLDRVALMMAQVGPTRTPQFFPRRQDSTAYAINAYNACIFQAVRAILTDRRPPDWKLARLDTEYAFIIDGRRMTPAEIRRWAIDLAGADWRVRFALCGGHAVGPPLWPRPILGDMIDGQLNEIVRAALARDSVVAVRHGERKLLELWSGLYVLRGRLVDEYERTTGARGATILSVLLEWSDADRRSILNSAVGYEVVEMPEGLALNIRPEPPRPGVFDTLSHIRLVRPGE